MATAITTSPILLSFFLIMDEKTCPADEVLMVKAMSVNSFYFNDTGFGHLVTYDNTPHHLAPLVCSRLALVIHWKLLPLPFPTSGKFSFFP